MDKTHVCKMRDNVHHTSSSGHSYYLDSTSNDVEVGIYIGPD
jgi:hypothetical protein